MVYLTLHAQVWAARKGRVLKGMIVGNLWPQPQGSMMWTPFLTVAQGCNFVACCWQVAWRCNNKASPKRDVGHDARGHNAAWLDEVIGAARKD